MHLFAHTLLLSILGLGQVVAAPDKKFEQWNLQEATRILNDSPWVSSETSTRVVGGIGSGIQGEKEIYNTYFVRFLSSPRIRQAYARIRQIQLEYDSLDVEQRHKVDRQIEDILNLDVSHWIVVALAFRSNNPREQARVRRFLESETAETMKNRAYLSTKRFPRVEVAAYFGPKEPTVGAKFVFPRFIEGVPVVSSDDKEIVFEFDTPGTGRELRARFSVAAMVIDGELTL